MSKILAFLVCCDSLERALKGGFLELDPVYSELILPRQKVGEDVKISNLLTGETYDPKEFSFSFHVGYCPFCGLKLDDFDQEFPEE